MPSERDVMRDATGTPPAENVVETLTQTLTQTVPRTVTQVQAAR